MQQVRLSRDLPDRSRLWIGQTDAQSIPASLLWAGIGGLAVQGTQLPPLGESSWHVDVRVRPIEFLGTYRRSRVTGLWFAGQHRYHSVGN